MERITGPTTYPNQNGTGKAGFGAGEVATQTPPTQLTPAWCNQVQEEIAKAVEELGGTVSDDSFRQLASMIAMRDARLAIMNATNRTAAASYAGFFVDTCCLYETMVAVGGGGASGARIQRSSDYGQTWASITPSGGHVGGEYFTSVCFGDSGRFVVVGSEAQYSDDSGANWAAGTGWSGAAEAVVFGCGVFCAVGSSGMIRTTSAGIAWANRTPAGGYVGEFSDVAASATLLVAVGVGGEIQTSPDGTTWTKRTQAGAYSGSFRGVTCMPDGTFVAVGTAGEIQSSPDGITWTRRAVGNTYRSVVGTYSEFIGNFSGVSSPPYTPSVGLPYGRQLAVAVGEAGAIHASLDGITWVSCYSPRFTTPILGVTYDQHSETVMLLGDGGLLRQSLII